MMMKTSIKSFDIILDQKMLNLTNRRKAAHLSRHRLNKTIHVNIGLKRNQSTDYQKQRKHRHEENNQHNDQNLSENSRQHITRSDHSIEDMQKQDKSWTTTTSSKTSRSKSSKVSHHETNIINNGHHIQTKDAWLEQTGNTIDYHQNAKKNKKKKKKKYIIKIAIITTIILFIVIAIILLVLLIKPKTVITRTAILRWNKTGITVAGVTGVSGNDNNLLNTPFGATVDYENTLYIADTNNNRVQKFLRDALNGTTVAGNANGSLGAGLNDLKRPSQVRIVSNGNMLIADAYNHRIMLWSKGSSSGVVAAGVTGIPSNTNNTLNYPFCIDYDLASNSLYVSDYINSRVMHYLLGASSGSIVAGGVYGKNITQLTNPVGIYFDSLSNSLIISNHFAYNVVRWPLGATSWTLLAGDINGNAGNTTVLLDHATDVTLDPMGNLYVADRDNQRIQLFTSGQSEGITIAGVTGIYGNTSTLFNQPWSVAFDNQLNLYVADSVNHRIQKFLRY